MTVRERIIASRLIEKIYTQADYANKIGLCCQLVRANVEQSSNTIFQKSEKVTQRFADGGYVKQYKDGTTERVRFTKTREVHDFDGPRGRASIWCKRK